MSKIDTEIKSNWIAALRSGEYKKCNLVSRDDNGCFCALGVLADIVAPDQWMKDNAGWFNEGFYLYDKNNYPEGFDPWSISDLNDDEINPASFEEIANWIEENLHV